jgi:AraC-like DNA-binding protein
LTHLQLVTSKNYKDHWQPDSTLAEAAQATDRLARPIRPSPEPIRIAMHNREICEVDRQLQAGALVAAAKLRAYNASVEFIPGGALRVKSVIETVIDQGYDALIVLAANKKDIFHVNRAVYMGIPVVTYNAEPISLRGIVNSLGERLEVLLGLRNGLTSIASTALGPVSAGLADSQLDPSAPQGERAGEMVRQAIEFMHGNIEQPISVADVAQSLYLNSAYFSRLFTEQTGRNPSDVLTEMRLERAKRYLAQTDMSVVDVAVALGYDRSYFSRLFKSRVGCSPGQYAMQQRSR